MESGLFALLFGAGVLLAYAPAQAASDFRDVATVTATINHTLERARTGVPVEWSNPETGHSGTVTAERTYYLDPATPCRDYTRTMRSPSGETLVVSGTGCRNPDGHWRLDEQSTAQPLPAPAEPTVEARRLPDESPSEPSWSRPEPEPVPAPQPEATREPTPLTQPPAPEPRPTRSAEAAAPPATGPAAGPATGKSEPAKAEAPRIGTVTVTLPSRSEG